VKFKGTWKYQDKAEAKAVQQTLEFGWDLSCTVKGVCLIVEGDMDFPGNLRAYLSVRAIEINFDIIREGSKKDEKRTGA